MENMFLNSLNKDPNSLLNRFLSIGLVPHDPRFVLYKYVSAETAKIILRNCALRFSSPTVFNDPFEFNESLIDFRIKIKAMKQSIFLGLETAHPGITQKEKQRFYDRISVAAFRDTQQKVFEDQKENTAVLCLSLNRKNTLMWSHYADSHRGVCIGLKMPTVIDKPFIPTLNVKYADKIEPICVMSGDDRERYEAILHWMYTKSKVWQYEQEVRSTISFLPDRPVFEDNLYRDVNFEPPFFCEIYYGVSTSKSDISEIEAILAAGGYKINNRAKMEINKGTFDLMEVPF
jgi:hypothetical protein